MSVLLEQKLEQLESLNLAIQQIEQGAQEYRINNRMVRRGELATLYKERQRLEQDIMRLEALEKGGGSFVATYYR